MARPKGFDHDDVVRRASELFRQRGYEATSMRDLLAHLELSSSSFYAAFGSKEALLKAALEAHAQGERELLREALTGPGGLRANFEGLFETLIDDLLGSRSEISLTLRAGVELAGSQPEVFRFLAGYIQELIVTVGWLLEQAQRRGEINGDYPPEDLARTLLFGAFNLGFIAKVSPERSKLEGYVAVVLSVLDRPSGTTGATASGSAKT